MSSGGNDSGRDQRGSMPKDHRRQNKQTRYASQKYKLTKAQQEQLHDSVHGQDGGFWDVMEAAEEIASEGRKPWKRPRKRK